MSGAQAKPRSVAIGRQRLQGDLVLPPKAKGLVIFAHGRARAASARAARVSRAGSRREAWARCSSIC